MIKTKVEEKRKEGLENLKYCTYEQLMQQLSRLVAPQDERDCRSFGQFEHVQYDSGEDSPSFLRNFVQEYLNDKERKNMKKISIEPLSLWGSIITIKSHSSVVETKTPLSEGECGDSSSSRLYGYLKILFICRGVSAIGAQFWPPERATNSLLFTLCDL